MRNLKKQLLCLIMLIPMLVLLGHDVIPHNHHLHKTTESQQVSIIHVHQHVNNACSHHNHGDIHWGHQHETNKQSCCILTHNRIQKEVKYQVFLKADLIQLDSDDAQTTKKLRVYNYRLISEPLRFSPLRRGPPSSNLA